MSVLAPYYLRRLAWIERDGTITGGCPANRREALRRLERAGLIAPDGARWTLTDDGRAALATHAAEPS